ncbi:MAG: SPOR domain-containing protein [Bacteriovoracaceae bacterium]|nr:SPOR domain-containing protein [Bacteriovoracaceae bacterium]
MSEKTKVYIFERFELALILLLILLVAVTSFVLGVKFGKTYSFEKAGLIKADRERVELLSENEEQVNRTLDQAKKEVPEHALDKNNLLRQNDARLSQKIAAAIESTNPVATAASAENFDRVAKAAPPPVEKKEATTKKDVYLTDTRDAYAPLIPDNVNQDQTTSEKSMPAARPNLSGKYTVQLGSHRSRQDAEKFAEGFRIRGHNPIISEVELKEKGGTWYRVSIGVFDSVAEAKDYILNQERALFQGQDYVIGRFD